MPGPAENKLHCVVCAKPFRPSRDWQRYCSHACCTEFHSRERKQMRRWWRQSQANGEIVDRHIARIDEAVQAHEVPAQVEPLRRRLRSL
jgi:predicted nucleic acid-binding Zn ribbon protein